MLDRLLLWDAELVYHLQQTLSSLPHFEILASACAWVGNPGNMYLVVFPLVYWWLGPRAGSQVLLTVAIGEWTSTILKWVLLGHRPYWWVESTPLWPSSHRLVQLPVTCKTTPGNPSGHVMVALAVLLVVGEHVKRHPPLHCPLPSFLVHAATMVLVTLIATSRLLTSCHFIHQVLIGVLLGVLLHRWITHSRFFTNLCVSRPNSRSLLLISLALLLLGVGVFHLWTWLGFVPEFAMLKALEHCRNPAWVDLDFTQFFSLMRSSGAVLGLATIAQWRSELWNRQATSGAHCCSGLLGSFGLLLLLKSVPIHFTSELMFYVLLLVKSALIPMTVAFHKILV